MMYVFADERGRKVYLIGEDHRNKGACWEEGEDIVDVIMTCVEEGMTLVLEMPPEYEEKTLVTDQCHRHPPADGPREDFLNDMRACAMELLDDGGSVRFTDPREAAGPMPFLDKEESWVEGELRRAMDGDETNARRNISRRYLPALRTLVEAHVTDHPEFVRVLCGDVTTDADAYIKAQWERRVKLGLAQLEEDLQKPFPNFIVDSSATYKKTMDAGMNVFTLWSIVKAVNDTNAPVVFYGGSAHVVDLADDMPSVGFSGGAVQARMTTQSCLLPRSRR